MREISREYTLECAHRLDQLPKSHKCHRLHGHSYRIRVSITGPVDPQLVWILDYDELDEIWRERVHDVLDHRYLNDIEGLACSTVENLIEWLQVHIMSGLPRGITISRIEVNEGLGGGRCVKIPGGSDQVEQWKDRQRDTLAQVRTKGAS
jgi:6-pyruvoyltetrahydropterin/6-carboxytetrahydropterin synthase